MLLTIVRCLLLVAVVGSGLAEAPGDAVLDDQSIVGTLRGFHLSEEERKLLGTENNLEGETGIHRAARTGLIGQLKSLLAEKKFDIDLSNDYGSTPLHVAAYWGQAGAADFLVKAGADRNAKDSEGATPLYVAAREAHIPVINTLVSAAPGVKKVRGDGGVNVNKGNKYGQTPLSAAAQRGYLATVRALTAVKGVDINLPTVKGETPLYLAARSNALAVTVKLVSANAKMNQATRSGETPLFAACAAGSLSTAKALVDSFARKDQATTSGATPLHAAASAGHDDVVALLLKAKPKEQVAASSVNLQTQLGETALFVASAAGTAGAVSLLLAAPGTDANRKTRLGYSPLFAAASAGHDDVVKLLLAYKPPTSATAAVATAGESDAKAEPGLLAVDVDLASQVGESPVYAASRNGHASTVALLCNAGANLNLRTVPARETALYRAAKNGEAQVCEVLLKHGADPKLVQKGGESPFYAAAATGQTAALTALLAHTQRSDQGAFNLAQKDGYTSMYCAARAGHVGALSALIAAGADVDQTSHKGDPPLLVAARAGEVGAVEVLIAAGAKQYKASPNKGSELAELLTGMGFTQTAVGYGKRNTAQMASGSASKSHK